ncbi:hypothetical protein DFH06DRAFT_581527 [Mycena polygramma]|nr:hypothetical protein DFH06DRAFT_581527 [Mycena polygramma]
MSPLLFSATCSTKATPSFELPTELWFEIFRNLPSSALCSLHAVSPLFHAITHPMFFRNLTLDPDQHPEHETEERLEMYTSDSIVKHVRSLSVSFQFGCWSSQSAFSTALDSPCPLVAPLLLSIPRFKHIRLLECLFRFDSEVHFAHLGLETLPHLDELRMHGGALYCPTSLPPPAKIRVTHFAYTAIPGIGPTHRHDTCRSFLSMLDPDALCALTLSPSNDSSPGAWLSSDRELYPTFRNLRSVSIGCDGPFLRPVHEFLAALPALRSLTLHGRYRRITEFAPEPGVVLRRGLRSYTGPCEYIPSFLPGTACKRLTVMGCVVPAELRAALEDTPCTGAVVHLTLCVLLAEACAWEAPHLLFALFPRLETLRLGITDSPLDEDDLAVLEPMETLNPSALSDLTRNLSKALHAAGALTQAVIEWDLASETAHMLPNNLSEMRDALVADAPKVERVVFEGVVRAGFRFAPDGQGHGSEEQCV